MYQGWIMFSHRIRRLISNLTHQVHSYVLPENAKSRWIQRIKKVTFLCGKKAGGHWRIYQRMLVRNTYMNAFQCNWSLLAIKSINSSQRAWPSMTLSICANVVPRPSRSLASGPFFLDCQLFWHNSCKRRWHYLHSSRTLLVL